MDKRIRQALRKNNSYLFAKGEYSLPSNVKVFSLGKEQQLRGRTDLGNFKRSVLEEQWLKIKYALNFYKYIWQERKNYDAVLVHMNQEYVLLGGIFWKLFSKKIYMWRNHHSGYFLTDIAALFCIKVFCTSKFSFTAKYKKTILMPVGVDTNKFIKLENPKVNKMKNSLLFLGRISPSKNVHLFIEALGILKNKGVNFTANIYGDALPEDISYLEKIKSLACDFDLGGILKFNGAVPNYQTPEIYNTHAIFINSSPSGMYDKTIFEAMACEILTLTSNRNLIGNIDDMFLFKEDDEEDLARRLAHLLDLPFEGKEELGRRFRAFVVSSTI